MEVTIANPILYFKLFYVLAFVFIFLVVLFKSIEKGYPLRSLLLMLTTITLFSVIGTRLITIPIDEWSNVLFNESNVAFNNRSAIGALLFGLIGLLISQRIFKFHKSILDVYAWAVPVGLGIQKIGCFINGCCFGKPTDVLWGVQYPYGSSAHYSQWSNNLIEANASYSAVVHPVQLYEMAGLFAIGFIVWKTRHSWKKNLSTFIFSFFMFSVFRFFIEFIRDPISSQFNSEYVFGIRTFQWMILGIGLILGLTLLLYEKYLKSDINFSHKSISHLKIDITFVIIISFLIYIFDGLLTKFELISIWIKFIPAILLLGYYLLTNLEYKKYRLVFGFIVLLPLYVIAQTVETDSVKVTKYNRIDFGGSFGSFFNEVKIVTENNSPPQNTGCGGSGSTTSYDYIKNSYNIGGVGYSRVTQKGHNKSIFGANIHAGKITTSSYTTDEEKTNSVFGVNPYYKYDGKWVGIGGGILAGNFRKNKAERIESANLSEAYKKYNLLPEFYIRLGRRDLFDVAYNYGFMFPSAYPTLYKRISIGSGFGKKSDYSLRYGQIYPIKSKFISAEGLISDHLGIKLMYIFKEEYNFNDSSFNDGSGKFVFGLNYRFDYKSN